MGGHSLQTDTILVHKNTLLNRTLKNPKYNYIVRFSLEILVEEMNRKQLKIKENKNILGNVSKIIFFYNLSKKNKIYWKSTAFGH